MRGGHRISSPKGTAKKEVHRSLEKALHTVNREARPHRSPNSLVGGMVTPHRASYAAAFCANDAVSLDTTFRLSTKKPLTSCYCLFLVQPLSSVIAIRPRLCWMML